MSTAPNIRYCTRYPQSSLTACGGRIVLGYPVGGWWLVVGGGARKFVFNSKPFGLVVFKELIIKRAIYSGDVSSKSGDVSVEVLPGEVEVLPKHKEHNTTPLKSNNHHHLNTPTSSNTPTPTTCLCKKIHMRNLSPRESWSKLWPLSKQRQLSVVNGTIQRLRNTYPTC